MSNVHRLVVIALASLAAAKAARSSAPDPRALLAAQPLVFEANRGQLEAAVPFLGRSANETVFLRGDGATLQFESSDGPAPRIELRWLGGDPAARAQGEWRLPGTTGYFFGPDPSRHVSGIPTFERVRIRDVYPGIDVLYRAAGPRLEYDFVVGPGADPRQIQIEIAGAEQVVLDAAGHLRARAGAAELFQPRPVIYQEVDGRRVEIDGGFAPVASASKASRFGFRLAAYDATRELVIDPLVLWYSTKTGGEDGIFFGDLAADSDGDLFVTGTVTRSIGQPFTLPTTTAFASSPQHCGFLMKIRATASSSEAPEILYSLVFGGGEPLGLAVGPGERAHVTGVVREEFAADLPFGHHVGDANHNGVLDAFVLSFSRTGNAIDFSTFLGGRAIDLAEEIAVDDEGHPCVIGRTDAEPGVPSFPQKPTIRPVSGSRDAFVACFDPTTNGTSATVFSLLLGGDDETGEDIGRSITARGAFDVVAVGDTGSSDFPLVNPLQASRRGSTDVFVTRIQGGVAAAIRFSTYFGGSSFESAGTSNGVLFEPDGSLVFVGTTQSTDFPAASGGFVGPNPPGPDGFVARLSMLRAGSEALIASVLFGGNGVDSFRSVARDPSTGAISIVGNTSSTDFPVRGPIDHRHPLTGAVIWDGRAFALPSNFLVTLDAALQVVRCSTSVPRVASTLATDALGAIYIGGQAELQGLPIVHPLRFEGQTVGQQGASQPKVGLVKIAPSGS
jgi:hypothetical protein